MSRPERASARSGGNAIERTADPASAGEAVSVRLHEPLPGAVEIGDGQFLVISGDCRCDESDRITGIDICLDGTAAAAELSPGVDGVVFWQAVYLGPELAGRTVAVKARIGTTVRRRIDLPLGTVRGTTMDRRPETPPAGWDGGERVAICMATFRPDPGAFRRQVDSIRRQTFENWLCIVNDDGTPDAAWREMRRYCEDDPRFRLFRNSTNLGFYRNFERALTRVPNQADYVAFCDQDDYWYPGKLSRLLKEIKAADAALVYSDMRIVDSDGAVVADSYWTNRRNEYRDLAAVLVANTVTGAASLFKATLLKPLLPFPPRVGDAFHDHWLACVALGTGRVAYVDESLYDYYQYGSSVIGHCDFTRFTLRQRAASLVRFVFRLCRPAVAGPLLRGKYASALAIYRGECRRLRLVGETIRRRCRVTGKRKQVLSLFDGGFRSLAGLLCLHVKVLVKGQTTDDAELRLAMGQFARIVEQRRGVGRH